MKHRLGKKQGKLIEVSLDLDRGYYFVYEDGMIFRVLKSDLQIEKSRTGGVPSFWTQFVSTLDEAVQEELKKRKIKSEL